MKTNNYQLTDWTDEDFNLVYKSLKKYFGGKYWINQRNERIYIAKSKLSIEKRLGLPYTSTSMCPMLALDCNVNIFDCVDKNYHFSHAVLNNEKHVVLVLQDENENEKEIVL